MSAKLSKDQIAAALSAEMQNLLKIDAVDPHRPFLELGADSIVLTEAVQKIDAAYGVKINVAQFFEDQSTIETLASYIADKTTIAPTVASADAQDTSHVSTMSDQAVNEPSQIDAAPVVALFQNQLDLLATTIQKQNEAVLEQLRDREK